MGKTLATSMQACMQAAMLWWLIRTPGVEMGSPPRVAQNHVLVTAITSGGAKIPENGLGRTSVWPERRRERASFYTRAT